MSYKLRQNEERTFVTDTSTSCVTPPCSFELQVSEGEPVYSLQVTTSMVVEDARCWDHDEPMRFYCKQDGVPVCMLCISTGKHQNHLFSSAEREYKERKKSLLAGQDRLLDLQKRIGIHIVHLKSACTDVQRSAEEIQGDIEHKYRDLHRALDEELGDVLEQLKQKTRFLVAEIEDRSCNMEGKLKHVQATEANLQLCLDNQEVLSFLMGHDHHVKRINETNSLVIPELHLPWLLDVADLGRTILRRVYGQPQALDVKTAHTQLLLSNDLTMVTASETRQSYPDLPQRYDCLWQVLGITAFTSGRHYWEVDTSRARYCRVGVTYPGIQRKGESADCWLGENPSSWCLLKYNATLSAWHNGVKASVSNMDPLMKVGLLLDKEAGTLRFYQVETMTLIHTFHATFSQGLCPALWISGDGDSLSING
uniref:nuclear factor 7, brain-like n=1 Tax=Myxine glutinosa TaxID=7769 RepID=UPI00358FF637